MKLDFSNILPSLQALAPTIATAIGGPIGGLAYVALEDALGLSPGTTQKDGGAAVTAAVLGMTPETAAAMRKADQEFAQSMRQLDINLEELSDKDRDSARNMQIATKDWTPRLIAVLVVTGLFSLLTLMTFYPLPTANHDALMLLLGALSAAFGAVIQFFFGSSSSSRAKDDTINKLSA